MELIRFLGLPVLVRRIPGCCKPFRCVRPSIRRRTILERLSQRDLPMQTLQAGSPTAVGHANSPSGHDALEESEARAISHGT